MELAQLMNYYVEVVTTNLDLIVDWCANNIGKENIDWEWHLKLMLAHKLGLPYDFYFRDEIKRTLFLLRWS